ncbi:probable inactive histone-lysine N-methyltransferase SUVR2 [Oryza glaberrima]|uniref:probable inactive histone-lysine N-methyltransferase SUVR2 n=1 Tax=Oryza glaberrima TaxID=4538 RepID=UPI00224C255A|nr:probable inactive histone-lysine N-methyltransferase SUVR2 [Oryza glaberrima]
MAKPNGKEKTGDTGLSMAPPKISKDRFDAAIRAMADIGILKETAAPVLNNLLNLFDYNWVHIEADNYLALADAIFCDSDPKEGQKRQANETNLDADQSNKKLKTKKRSQNPTSKMHGNDNREFVEAPPQQGRGTQSARTVNGKKVTRAHLELPSSQLLIKEPHTCPSIAKNTTIVENNSAVLCHGQDLQTFEVPVATTCPQVVAPSTRKDARRTSGAHHDQKHEDVYGAHERNRAVACSNQEIVSSKDSPSNIEVVLSNYGAGKLSFTYNSSLANRSDFHLPDIKLICKKMEARCLRKYKSLEPNFSFKNLIKDTCQCIVESSGPRHEGIIQTVPALDILSKPSVPQILQSNQANSSFMPPNNVMSLGGTSSSCAVAGVSQNSSNMPVVPHQLHIGANRPPHDVNDITKGEERLRIPIINEYGNGILPPPFHYIPHNTTLQEAYVNISLARIGDDNCCSDCFRDCLAQSLPCACAAETGGEFAYTTDGLLKGAFLDSCISMIREPLKHPHFYCKICPNERMKIEVNSDSSNTEMNPGPCKGHLTRKFIKECWRKCGCTRNCGNRVVQRGITRHLQVFLTPEKKGWGLRSTEKLPRGAFVCEYVGEILTNIELYDRTIQKTGKAKHTYPLLLDADWGTEGVLKDEEALCLDATFYGNVARFINHRCFDANIIGIPVEIETPDHHYYHLAFFTTRIIEPFEELTWDYGIDFDDVDHPVKAFKCHCGSEFCRDKTRRSKSRARV